METVFPVENRTPNGAGVSVIAAKPSVPSIVVAVVSLSSLLCTPLLEHCKYFSFFFVDASFCCL